MEEGDYGVDKVDSERLQFPLVVGVQAINNTLMIERIMDLKRVQIQTDYNTIVERKKVWRRRWKWHS